MIIIEDLTDQLKTVLVKAPRGGTQEIMLGELVWMTRV